VAAQDAATTSSAGTPTYRLSAVVIDSARAPIPEADATVASGRHNGTYCTPEHRPEKFTTATVWLLPVAAAQHAA